MSDVEASLARNDTLPKRVLHNEQVRGSEIGFREKDLGIWQSYTWLETAEQIRALACGLAKQGLARGDRVAIIGDNRPQLYWAFFAIQSIGATPVPLYQDSVAEEMQYVLQHADVRFAIVEDQEQTDKVLSVMDQCPILEKIIYEDPRGMRHYKQDFVLCYADVQEQGREFDRVNSDFYLSEIAKGAGADMAVILYTSGTTGRPKGVMLSADNFIESSLRLAEMENLTSKEEMICYMPMAWVGDHLFFVQGVVLGFTISCPESGETVMSDLREIGPTYYFSPPAIFESLLTSMTIRMENAGAWKRKMFTYFKSVAERVGVDILEGRPVPLFDRLLYKLGDLCVFGPLRNNLGLSRVRIAYTAGAPLGPEVFNFYRGIGINLKQLYGQTECSAYACIQRDSDVRPDTVGPPANACDVKIDASGEVLIKSPGNFMGYLKNDEATKETKDADGWLHTGDAGIMTDEGHLKVIDRAKDVGKLNDGGLFAPQYIENKLKFFPFIREAVVHGAGKDHVAAFINIDLEAVGDWAERNGVSYSGYTDLAGQSGVYDLIQKNIAEVNKGLAFDSELSSSQIRRFLILHKELDADDGELTRTRKIRRSVIAERYDDLINALYSDCDHISVEAKMTFEDGRTGAISADLAIRDVQTFTPLREAG
jgi:long-chain acyl-CoA synthetase